MCLIKSNWHWLCSRFDFKVFLVLLSISFSVPLSPNLLPGVCGRTALLPLLCHQAADGERPHWLHHRRGALFAQWGQAHQTTDWLQDTGKGITCLWVPGLKEDTSYAPRDRRKEGVVLGYRSRDERAIKLSLSRLTCTGARDWRPHFLFRQALSSDRAGL